MNRLQKKCFIATAGFHLLLLVILFVGPAFFSPKPKVDDSQVLDVIPANLIDAAFSSGVKGATPPPPTPVFTPPQPVQPPVTPPPAPKPVVQPPPNPAPTLVERVEKMFTPEPVKPTKPVPEAVVKPAAEKPKIKVSLTPTVRTVPNTTATTAKPPKPTKPDNSRNTVNPVNSTLEALRKNLSSATTVDMPGDSSAAYANYANAVKSAYDRAWTPPTIVENDDANAKVSVTVASDGTVISARIITPSGDSGVDATVKQALDRVPFIAPFPAGTTDKERTYIINFNLKAKRMLG